MSDGISKFEFRFCNSLLVELGASKRLGPMVKDLGCRKPIFVSDKGIASAGLFDDAVAGMRAVNLDATLFSDVEPDPTTRIVDAGVQKALDVGADCVIGFGGGSAMDVAKVIAALVGSGQRLEDVCQGEPVSGPRLPLVLVPTTAGTGSEVTPIAILTTEEDEKKGLVSPLFLPDHAVLDADLTRSLPPKVCASTGIDAMVHAIEAITSARLKNPLSDCLAEEALKRLAGNIVSACKAETTTATRQDMLLGATLAGMAFANAPVGGVHALAYPIGARFHVPHGLSNSLVLWKVIEFNACDARTEYEKIGDILSPYMGEDASREGVEGLIEYLRALPKRLGLPTRLSEVGIRKGDIEMLATDAMRQERLLVNNPRTVTERDASTIYSAVL